MKKLILFPFLIISILSFSQKNKTNIDGEVSNNLDANIKVENNVKKISVKENPAICNKHIKVIQDPMTDDIFRSMKEEILLTKDNKKGFTINISEVNRAPSISFKSLEDDCVKKYNHVSVWLKDGTELSLSNALEYNCEGKSTVYFGERFNKFDILELLTKNQITRIRVNTFNGVFGFIEEDISEEKSLILMTVLDCLYRGLPR